MDARNRIKKVKQRSRKMGVKSNLTTGWLREKLKLTNCEVTGLPFDKENTNSPFYPSIDRVDSELGYTKDNCQLVVIIYNFAKSEYSVDVFHGWIKKFVEVYENNEVNMGKYLQD